jgi:hypothetical protein
MFLLQSCSCVAFIFPGHLHGARKVHKTLYISQEFDEDEVALIEDAAKEWEDKTDGIVEFDIIYNWNDQYNSISKAGSIAVIKVSNGWAMKHLDGVGYRNEILGLYVSNATRPTIYLVYDRALGKEFLKATALHELGHAISLGHNKSTDSVMYYSTEVSAREITKNDLIVFCEIHHCRASELIHRK